MPVEVKREAGLFAYLSLGAVSATLSTERILYGANIWSDAL